MNDHSYSVAVSGGLSGIGAAVVDEGRRRGWSMQAGSRRNGLDVRNQASIETFLSKHVRCAVACAGISESALFLDIDPASIRQIIRTNVDGSFLFAREAIRHGAESILFIGSLSQLGAPSNAVYSASKAAVVGLARAMAREYAAVRVNVLVPGFVLTDMTASLPERQQRSLRAASPLQRAVEPDEVARAAADIIVSSTSGQVIRVAAGLLETPL